MIFRRPPFSTPPHFEGEKKKEINNIKHNNLFICGGNSSGVIISDCNIYDISKNEWTDVKVSGFKPIDSHTASRTDDDGGDVIIFGGDTNNGQTNTIGRMRFHYQ